MRNEMANAEALMNGRHLNIVRECMGKSFIFHPANNDCENEIHQNENGKTRLQDSRGSGPFRLAADATPQGVFCTLKTGIPTPSIKVVEKQLQL